MASSRRTSPAKTGRQQEWAQEPNDEAITSGIRVQSGEDQRGGERRRELLEISRKHLERVINTMIPSSTCSSMDPAESAPVNSLVSQLTERSIEGTELKQVSMEREKQVIVNNYYINNGKEGWKQLEKSEIPLNTLENKTQGNFTEIPPNRSENDMQGNFSEISPEKSHLCDFNAPSGREKETRYLDRDHKNITQAKQSPGGFMNKKQKYKICHPHQHTTPTIHHQTDIWETKILRQC